MQVTFIIGVQRKRISINIITQLTKEKWSKIIFKNNLMLLTVSLLYKTTRIYSLRNAVVRYLMTIHELMLKIITNNNSIVAQLFPSRFRFRRTKDWRVSESFPASPWLSLPLTQRLDFSVTVSTRTHVLSPPRVHSRLLRGTRLSLVSNPKATRQREGNTRLLTHLRFDRACRIYQSSTVDSVHVQWQKVCFESSDLSESS